MASHASLALRTRTALTRSKRRPLRPRCGAGLHLGPPEYDPDRSKVQLAPPKHAYGLSIRQMAALGLTGDQVQKQFQVEAVKISFSCLSLIPLQDALTSKAHVGGEYVNEATRIATRMAVARPSRKSPPDLPSLILDGRIVYIGMPLVPSVTELVICELLWLNYDQAEQPVYIYINSTGSQTPDGQSVGSETEAYAILDTLDYIRPKKYTIALSQAYGNAALILAAGERGRRYSMPHSRIKLQAPVMNQAYDIATNATIKANELQVCTDTYVELMSEYTGRDIETVKKESGRDKYLTPEDAIEYGLMDKVVESEEAMIMERDYDRMLLESQAMARQMGGGDGPSTGAE